MKQILIKDSDQSIAIELNSNTLIPGSFINAEYFYDANLSAIENLIEKIELKVYNSEIIKKNQTKYITNTKVIKTYDDVLSHFTEMDDKYFVTGVTNSKFELISKYFQLDTFVNSEFIEDKKFPKLEYTKYVGTVGNFISELVEDLSENKLFRTNIKLDIPGLDISGMILSETTPQTAEYVLYLDTENPIKYVDLGNGLSIFKYLRSHTDDLGLTPNVVLYEGFVDEPKIISEVFIDRGLNSAFERIKRLKNIKDINELTKTGLGFYKINTRGYNFKTT